VKCDFSGDLVIGNVDSAMKPIEGEENDYHNIHLVGVQSEDNQTCGNVLKVCGVWSIYQMLAQLWIGPKMNQKRKRKLQNRKYKH
jgi:hypothetical protein